MATTEQYFNSPVDVAQRRNLDVRPGDTIKVYQKIQEKGKTRIQLFEGLVIARKHGSEPGATITVRKVASGVGMEKIFPLYSPNIDKIEVVKRSKVRRSKLYFIREKATREIRKRMRGLLGFTWESPEATPEPEVETPEVPEVVETQEVIETPTETPTEAPVESSNENL